MRNPTLEPGDCLTQFQQWESHLISSLDLQRALVVKNQGIPERSINFLKPLDSFISFCHSRCLLLFSDTNLNGGSLAKRGRGEHYNKEISGDYQNWTLQ